MEAPSLDDPYKRLDYRRQIAWPQRIAREWPFLEEVLMAAPERTVVDLGCGTGEHAHFFASKGYRAVGVDRSPDQIEEARERQREFASFGPEFVCGELRQLPELTGERFGAAVCLGNVVPHLEDEELSEALGALAGRLLIGARVLVQLVNYERVVRRDVRHLPLNVRDDPEVEGEIVFLRLLKQDGDRHVMFFPSTLLLRPGEDPPLTIKASRKIRLRAWRREELERTFTERGFRIDGVFGDMKKSRFEPESSSDLVVVAVFEDRATVGPGDSGGDER